MRVKFISIAIGLALIALCALLGCNDDDVSYDWPGDIDAMCDQQLDDARNCIQGTGVGLKERWSCSLFKNMTCDKKATSGYWCWYDPTWKMYVGGLYHTKKVEVGCNRNTGGEVHAGVVKHEFGHHWLISNQISSGHDAKYHGCFINWHDPATKTLMTVRAKTFEQTIRTAQLAYAGLPNETWMSVSGFDASNQFFHIDFVRFRDEPAR